MMACQERNSITKHWPWSQMAWIHILAKSFTRFVTSGRSLNLSTTRIVQWGLIHHLSDLYWKLNNIRLLKITECYILQKFKSVYLAKLINNLINVVNQKMEGIWTAKLWNVGSCGGRKQNRRSKAKKKAELTERA